ncbi:MAG: dual specificity protein phosphatase family protein [Pseudomonas sp.]|uniref:dual specificity protein phosphatase family protein n=1 Tax=Pseudomonas sp. TaxID=306 RepID=UPI003D13FB04
MRTVSPSWPRYCALLLLMIAPLAWCSTPMRLETRPAAWATPLDKRLNLYRMDTGLYRSALPDTEAVPVLRGLGIKTVINLYQRSDAGWMHDPDLHLVHLPLHTDRIDDSDVLDVLRSLRQAQARGPVLIHCKHGQHRTGLIAALYRVVYQGWTKEQALAEMRLGGFGGEQRLGDAEAYLHRVDVHALRVALASGACSTQALDLCHIGNWLSDALGWR